MYNVLYVGLFGALGAMSRYGANRLCFAVFGDRFAIGTLVVNVVGCFLLGLLVPLGHRLGPIWQPVLATGFLGALTTFSTFSLETIRHLEKGEWSLAALNAGLNLGLGLLAAWAGLETARAFSGDIG